MVRKQRRLHVLAHAHRAEGGGDLEGAPDAEPPDAVRRQPDQAGSAEADIAASGAS